MKNSFYCCKNSHIIIVQDESTIELEFDMVLCPVCRKLAPIVVDDAPYMIAEYKYQNGELVRIVNADPKDFPLKSIRKLKTASSVFEVGERFRKVEWEAEKANNAMFENVNGTRVITSPKDFKL